MSSSARMLEPCSRIPWPVHSVSQIQILQGHVLLVPASLGAAAPQQWNRAAFTWHSNGTGVGGGAWSESHCGCPSLTEGQHEQSQDHTLEEDTGAQGAEDAPSLGLPGSLCSQEGDGLCGPKSGRKASLALCGGRVALWPFWSPPSGFETEKLLVPSERQPQSQRAGVSS